jgi:hypothetical protein
MEPNEVDVVVRLITTSLALINGLLNVRVSRDYDLVISQSDRSFAKHRMAYHHPRPPTAVRCRCMECPGMHENDIFWCSCQFLNSHVNAVDAPAIL